jgi:hypothetical protein
MVQQRIACYYVNEPRGFYLLENIIIVRRKFLVVQQAHRGGVQSTGVIQPSDEISLYRALWRWLHSMSDTRQRDIVTAPGSKGGIPDLPRGTAQKG